MIEESHPGEFGLITTKALCQPKTEACAPSLFENGEEKCRIARTVWQEWHGDLFRLRNTGPAKFNRDRNKG